MIVATVKTAIVMNVTANAKIATVTAKTAANVATTATAKSQTTAVNATKTTHQALPPAPGHRFRL